MARSKNTMFTDTMIKKLKPEESKYIRSEGNGFTIRVMPSGCKTWLYLYSFDSKRREMNLGNYPDVSLETARESFDTAKKKLKNGIDPLAEREQAADERRRAPTVADLVDEYIKKYAMKFKRSWQEDERILKKEVLPFWGKRKAQDIKKRDVILLLEGIVERGSPGMANNTFKIIRKMLNYAVEKDILILSVALGVKLPAPSNARERVLSQDEIKLLWCNLDTASISDDIRRVIKLILITAQRPGEVIGMHTSEIDGNWWTIPVERSKNGKTHRVYLTALALDTITQSIEHIKRVRNIPAEQEYCGFVFPCPHKNKYQSADRHAISRAIARNITWPLTDDKGKPLYTKEGKPATKNRLGVEHFTPHDLRRTAATFMAKAGEMDEVIDAVLNHAKQGIIKVYNQYRYDKEKQQALEAWERKLNSIITGKESNVIPIGRKAA